MWDINGGQWHVQRERLARGEIDEVEHEYRLRLIKRDEPTK